MKSNPYIGPRPYRRGESNFFGREREGKELAWLILAEQAVLFYAQSGAGKTSLLNARVIPILEQKGVRVLPVARVGSGLPESIASEQVDNIFTFSALLSLSADADLPSETLVNHTLLSYLKTYALSSQLSAVSSQLTPLNPQPSTHNSHSPTLLIFDQFEEIATTHRERWAEAEGFFHQVREAIDNLPGLGVLFVLREDYVAELDPYTPLLPSALHARFRMTLPTRPQAMQIVRGPAEQAGVPFAEEAAHNLVANLSRIKTSLLTSPPVGGTEGGIGQYVEPVQLQVVCQQLWESLPDSVSDDGVIEWDEIKHYNVDDALTTFYETTLAKVSEPSQGFATPVTERRLRRWFSEALITLEGRRGLALQGATETAGLPNVIVSALENYHLIRAETRGGSRWYELSHDRLVEPIVRSNRGWEAAQDQMHPWRPVARQWKAARSETLLYRGKELKEAQAWLEAVPSGEVELYEREFIQESLKAEQARIRARARDIITVTALAILVVVLSVQPIRRQLLKWQAQRLGELAWIAESVAYLGNDELSPSYALTEKEYNVPAFGIEKYEVTNDRYLLCISAGACSPPNAAYSYYTTEQHRHYPVTYVTAIQASQFCAWIDRRLPTELEWERAARFTMGWHWPWGDEPGPSLAQAYFSYTEEPNPLPVQEVGKAHNGASPEGIYDLAGNASEWTCTPYIYDTVTYDPNECVDLLEEVPDFLIIKGGSGYDQPDEIGETMAHHNPSSATRPYAFIGFRCAAKR